MIHAKYICSWFTSSSWDYVKQSPFWPLSGGGNICDPRDFIFLTNLNLLVPRMLCVNLKSTLASGSWEDFLSYLLYILTNTKLCPFGGAFMTPWSLFAQTWISLSQGYFIPNTNAFALLVCERNIFQILLLKPLSEAQNRPAPSFAYTLMPIRQR